MQGTLQETATSRADVAPRQRRYAILTARYGLRRLAFAATLLAVLGVWYLVTSQGWVRPFLLPAPQAVAGKFQTVLLNGTLWTHTRVTLHAVLVGLAAGVTVGVVLGYAIARIPILEDIFSPFIIAFQSTPVVAYAPLLVIWFGSGVQSKVITCALIVFFPMLMNTVTGVRGVSSSLRDLMRVSGASRWQTLVKLELPAAMPVLLTGLKTSATLSVIGAVVGEFIFARAGLGFLISLARGQYDTPLVFVAVLTLTGIASLLYGLVAVAEHRLLAWRRRGA